MGYLQCLRFNKRYLKPNLIFDRQPFILIFKLLRNFSKGYLKIFSRDLLSKRNINSFEEATYENYSEFLKNNNSKLDIWKKSVPKQIDRLKRAGIDYKNKKILIISGGPGILAKYLSKYSDVTITEFSQKTVDAMKKYLNLNAYKFDLNKDELSNILNDKYDLIYAESVVNFSKDINKFVSSICSLLNHNGSIIISNDSFSLGYAMSWQFEDYIPTNFPNQSTFLSYFYRNGNFNILRTEENKYNSFIYRTFVGGWKSIITNLFRLPFWVFYIIKANRPFTNLNTKLWSQNIIYYLNYESNIKEN